MCLQHTSKALVPSRNTHYFEDTKAATKHGLGPYKSTVYYICMKKKTDVTHTQNPEEIWAADSESTLKIARGRNIAT
ncbi:hypothetical protein Y032_0155g3052 [Ancylostoma ceylanicum]|uniref:Uncharacterized protein n=1 Tax=Ancylostoma ceylanicum TaxID=53326 RepID=A0A016SZE9_9BILA|nr:hypothetical protein Y032_0155g3052 [Ancylostoma ceylanicum]